MFYTLLIVIVDLWNVNKIYHIILYHIISYHTCGLIDSAESTKKLVTVCSFFFVLAFFKQI